MISSSNQFFFLFSFIALDLILIVITVYWKYFKGLYNLLKTLAILKTHERKYSKGSFSYANVIETKVDLFPDFVQFENVETNETRTLAEVERLANQIANWGLKMNLKPHDTIALMLFNNVDYFSIWYGFSKIGVAVALLNTNITGKAFTYSIETSLKTTESKILIIDSELNSKLNKDLDALKSEGIQVYTFGEQDSDLALQIKNISTSRPSRSYRKEIKEKDPLIFIFTSGTTGLPKACKISQTRYYLGSYLYPNLCELNKNDVIYSPLPLYHSAAGLLGIGGAINIGIRYCFRKKFSASSFSSDCIKCKATTVQYIGELCRYLTSIPPNSLDSQLKLKTAFGNGMRTEYWELFQKRYNIKRIVEFYSATEGNVGLFNSFDQIGALGFVPKFLDFIYPVPLVRVDPDDPKMPIRDSNGYCIPCKDNEVGLLISAINTKGGLSRRFEGYTESKATSEKLLADVFQKGDKYFNTGDLLYRDKYGFFYWSDRAGDTFRWKGENVSTTEISQILSHCVGVKDVVVYGVSIPNTDGKAGMAALVCENNSINLESISEECTKDLPPYARPLFLRLKSDGKLPTTTTHKYVKTDLIKEVNLFLIIKY